MSLSVPPLLGAMNYVEIVKSASPVELAVLVLLLGTSAFSWALIAMKWSQLGRAQAQSLQFLEMFWQASRLDAVYQASQPLEGSPLARVFRAGYEELRKLAAIKENGSGATSERLGGSGIENVERALHRAATAAGLFAAIPAVVAYNSFVSRIKVFDNEMSNFSADLLNIIKRHVLK